MISINSGDKNYSVRFFYTNVNDPNDKNPLADVTGKKIKTTCVLAKKVKDKEYETLQVATSINHPSEKFTKDAGRKISLNRALANIFPSFVIKWNKETNQEEKVYLTNNKVIRKNFWHEYFLHHKEGKSIVAEWKD